MLIMAVLLVTAVVMVGLRARQLRESLIPKPFVGTHRAHAVAVALDDPAAHVHYAQCVCGWASATCPNAEHAARAATRHACFENELRARGLGR